MRSDNDCSDLAKHCDTLLTEFVSQFESELFLNARLCPGDAAEPERCHLGLLVAASDHIRRLVTEAGLAEEEDVTLILPDTSKQDLVCFRKCLYGKGEGNEAVSSVFSMLGIKTPPERKMTVVHHDIGASSVETLMTFNLPNNLSHPDSVVDLKDISIEDLNSSLINNTTTSALINTIDVNKLGVTNAVDQQNPGHNNKLDNQQKVSIKSDIVPRKFQCSICFKKLATEKKLQSHRSRVHLSNAGKNAAAFKCSECDLNLASANSLEIHLRSHTGHRPFSCSECDKSFTSLQYLLQHKEFHRKGKDFECDICSKRYQNSNALSQHKVDYHNNVKFQCGLCLKLFSAKRYLKEHEKKKHSEGATLKYDCDICGKKLSGKNELKIHSRIHSGEKPYHCSDCNKYFRARSTYTIHLKSHTGTKNAVCEECGKRFIQWGDLRKHMRTHTGERPFQCPSCDRSFARKDYLVKHEKTHDRRKKSDKGSKREVTSTTSPLAESVDSEKVVIDMSDLRTFVTDTDGSDIQVVRILDTVEEEAGNIDMKEEETSVMYVIAN